MKALATTALAAAGAGIVLALTVGWVRTVQNPPELDWLATTMRPHVEANLELLELQFWRGQFSPTFFVKFK